MRLRADGLTWRELDGETVLLDLVASTYMTANGTGSFLLKQLVDERTREELVAAVVDEYDVPRERAEADTDAFVRVLQDKGLLAATADAPSGPTP
jgi:hypothetical protein